MIELNKAKKNAEEAKYFTFFLIKDLNGNIFEKKEIFIKKIL